MNHPGISMEINSVFSPDTVDHLSKSIRFIMNLGVTDIRYSLSILKPWDKDALLALENEISKLRKTLLFRYERMDDIPLVNFRYAQEKGIFYCAAGKDRLAIATDGGIWGCFLFADYFKDKKSTAEHPKFFFGYLDDFVENYTSIYPRIYSNYENLRMDNFHTARMECFLCKNLEKCSVCPINASLSGAPLGQIPDYACEIQKIKISQQEKFERKSQ